MQHTHTPNRVCNQAQRYVIVDKFTHACHANGRMHACMTACASDHQTSRDGIRTLTKVVELTE